MPCLFYLLLFLNIFNILSQRNNGDQVTGVNVLGNNDNNHKQQLKSCQKQQQQEQKRSAQNGCVVNNNNSSVRATTVAPLVPVEFSCPGTSRSAMTTAATTTATQQLVPTAVSARVKMFVTPQAI